VVPSRLAVHKKRPWWAQAARVVVGTAAMAVAGAAGAAVSKVHQVGSLNSSPPACSACCRNVRVCLCHIDGDPRDVHGMCIVELVTKAQGKLASDTIWVQHREPQN
jgi:hypothetical protein